MDVSEVEQRPYVEIAFLRGRNARVMPRYEKHWMIRPLTYRTVACWVETLKSERVATGDLPRSGRPESAHTEVQVTVIEYCLTDERRWTVAELSAHSDISASRVFRILWKHLKMRELCATCVR